MSITDHRRRLAKANARLAESGWTWAARTSDENVDPPTFGTDVSLASVLPTDHRTGRDDMAMGNHELSIMTIRVSNVGVSTMPSTGDRVTDSSGNNWSVDAIESEQWGSTVYQIKRDIRKTVGAPRGRWPS